MNLRQRKGTFKSIKHKTTVQPQLILRLYIQMGVEQFLALKIIMRAKSRILLLNMKILKEIR